MIFLFRVHSFQSKKIPEKNLQEAQHLFTALKSSSKKLPDPHTDSADPQVCEKEKVMCVSAAALNSVHSLRRAATAHPEHSLQRILDS